MKIEETILLFLITILIIILYITSVIEDISQAIKE